MKRVIGRVIEQLGQQPISGSCGGNSQTNYLLARSI